MDQDIKVTKRDGSTVPFVKSKILEAIRKASISKDLPPDTEEVKHFELIFITEKVCEKLAKEDTSVFAVEHIQDVVEETLIRFGYSDIAKVYILYRSSRSKIRDTKDYLVDTFKKLTYTKSTNADMKRENANIDADCAMGTMLKYGSESSKFFVTNYVLPKEIAKAHTEGSIHIHK